MCLSCLFFEVFICSSGLCSNNDVIRTLADKKEILRFVALFFLTLVCCTSCLTWNVEAVDEIKLLFSIKRKKKKTALCWPEFVVLCVFHRPFLTNSRMPDIQFGWIANCVSNATLYCYWSTSYGERGMNMQYQITMIVIVFGKKWSETRSLISSTTPWLISNSSFTKLTG